MNNAVTRVTTTIDQEARIGQWLGTRIAKSPISWAFTLPKFEDSEQLLDDALMHLVRRHSALRMYFPYDDPTFAAVLNHEATKWHLRRFEPEDTDVEVSGYLDQPFDPSSWPMMRACTRSVDNRTLVGLSVDHAVFDGASVGLATNELLAELFSPGRPTYESDFASFGSRQREWMASQEGLEAMQYWLHLAANYGIYPQLPKEEALLEICGDGSDDSEVVEIGHSDVGHIISQCRSMRVTPYVLLVTATLVTACQGQDTSGIEFPVRARKWSDTRSQIGNFSNVLPLWLRREQDAEDVLRKTLEDTRRQLYTAIKHEMFPYRNVIDSVGGYQASISPSRPPCLFVHDAGSPLGRARAQELARTGEAAFYDLPLSSAKFEGWDLSMDLSKNGGNGEIRCRFKSDRYSRKTVRKFLEDLASHLLDKWA